MNKKESNIQIDWTQNISNIEEKLIVANKVAEFVKSGDVIGFGSGSTSLLAVREIAKKVSVESLKITAVPTSQEIKAECKRLNIPVVAIGEIKPDWAFDGADEVDSNNWLIKGRGGAMFKEKQVIAMSPKTYILIDKSKLVKSLGDKCPVPVECEIGACDSVKEALLRLGAKDVSLRYTSESTPYITEQGNYILDCKLSNITSTLEREINNIAGVVENGLFIGYNIEIIQA